MLFEYYASSPKIYKCKEILPPTVSVWLWSRLHLRLSSGSLDIFFGSMESAMREFREESKHEASKLNYFRDLRAFFSRTEFRLDFYFFLRR